MRFLFYDSVTRIEKGRDITGVKTFSLSEEFLRGHFEREALVPGVIFIEAMAQLLGWLVIYSHDFTVSPILTLVEGAQIPSRLRPGFRAEIYGEIISTSRRDTLGAAAMFIDGEKIASASRIIYSHFDKIDPDELYRRFCYYSGIKEQRP
jgi:3-hydroxyacyl-[acyl-carrier-protein] dehydratase